MNLGLRAVLCSALATISAAGTVRAQPCYRDDAGRTVRQWRPGFVEVPCPDATTPAQPIAAPTESSANAPDQTPTETAPLPGPPARVSPIPKPRMTDYVPSVPVPDRWRIVDALGYQERWWDPYNRSVIKGDRPLHGDWFFNAGLLSDSVWELRQVPTPVGISATRDAGALDVFGRSHQAALAQNLGAELVYYQGDTVWKPPDWEFRFTPVFNVNHVRLQEFQGVNVDPRVGRTRTDSHLGIQAAFVDKHLRDVSERYDFDSIRVGIQPFSTDFRGFLFQDNQLGIRLFGTRNNNVYQYNVAWFRRLEKDTNSGLNDLTQRWREDDVFIVNLYRQDVPAAGFTSQLTVVYNRNREGEETYYDRNGVLQRPAAFGRQAPRDYDVAYLGYNGDGHFGALNLTSSFYYVVGRETEGTFVPEGTTVSALFAAAEASVDFDWIRVRLSGLYGSGDRDPYDDTATGFDAIFENPQFAGADTSYWIRQAVPLVGGGRVALSGRNGVLNSLRPSKDEAQSNFTNPGIVLAGVGADLDVLPSLRVSLNANTLFFGTTQVLEAARSQAGIDKHIGYDLSTSLIWRPLFSQNLVFRASYATLLAGSGYRQLFAERVSRSALLNAVLTY